MSRAARDRGLRVAIDGPSGSGKGTAAARLAEALGLPVLDTGLLYRLVGCYALEAGVDPGNEPALLELLDRLVPRLAWRPDGIFVDGEEWTPRLRSEAAGANASKAAALPGVRRRLLELQRRIAAEGCVMDGRDIGTVVLPDAEAKFFLTASVRERARRRWAQLQGGGAGASLDDVLRDLRERDRRDAERAHSPLRQAEDAVYIDSTTMQVDEVVAHMLAVLRRRGLIRTGEAAE